MAEDAKYQELNKEITDQYKAVKNQREKLLEDQMQASWDAFKGKYDSAQLEKWKKTEGTKWRSKVFVRLTKMKVVSASAAIEDILFQTGDLPWDITPTPEPMSTLPGVQLTSEIMRDRCDKMKKRIKDTIVETRAISPFTRSIQEEAVYGWSWLKFPILKKYERVKFTPKLPQVDFNYPDMDLTQQMRFYPSVEEYWRPSMIHPSVWDIYWDLEDSDPQKGQCIIHRMDVSPGMLRAIAEEKPAFYDMTQVESIITTLKDAKGTTNSRNPYLADLPERLRGIVLIEYYGRVEKDLLKKSGVPLQEEEKKGNEREIICALAGAEDDLKIIRPPKENKLPMKVRPLWISRWEYGLHEPGGIGIAENIKDSQEMVNSGTRTYVDNKKLSSNLMIAGKSANLAPGVSRAIMPGKWYEVAEHVQDVRQALQWFSPPDIGQGMLELINLFERFSDEESNLPKILQGEQARYQPKTAFEMSKLLQSANKCLSKVIRNKDDGHIEPYINSLYTYYMIADSDENIKGDYTCKASGFNSFMDNQVKGANMLNILTFALSNAVIGIMTEIPDLWREVVRTQGMDVERFVKSNDKIDAVADQIAMAMQANAQANAMGGMPPGGPGGGPPPQEIPAERMAA